MALSGFTTFLIAVSLGRFVFALGWLYGVSKTDNTPYSDGARKRRQRESKPGSPGRVP